MTRLIPWVPPNWRMPNIAMIASKISGIMPSLRSFIQIIIRIKKSKEFVKKGERRLGIGSLYLWFIFYGIIGARLSGGGKISNELKNSPYSLLLYYF
jgi:hypothetical protein